MGLLLLRDVFKAFDSLNHSKIPNMMNGKYKLAIGVGWIASYISGQTQRSGLGAMDQFLHMRASVQAFLRNQYLVSLFSKFRLVQSQMYFAINIVHMQMI